MVRERDAVILIAKDEPGQQHEQEGLRGFCSLVMITGRVFRQPVVRGELCRFSVKTEDGNFFVQGDMENIPDLVRLRQGQEVAVVGHLESSAGKCGQPHGRVAATGVHLLDASEISRGIVEGILEMWGQGSAYV